MVAVNAAPNPIDPGQPQDGAPSISTAADRARAQLHEEIERVRLGVEEMLAEQGSGADPDLRREIDALREDTRLYVKKRIRRTEKKLDRRISSIDERTRTLEQRIDRVEADRVAAEYRIHADTERMLDGLLQEVRGIADMLTKHP
jgi:septation ring formation regulator EzrA